MADLDVVLLAVERELDEERLVGLPLVVVDDCHVDGQEALILDHGDHLVYLVVVLASLCRAVDGLNSFF